MTLLYADALETLQKAMAERDALAAELAEVKADRQGIWAAAVKAEARVQALEAHLRKADRIEGDIGAEQWYAERDALLSSPSETHPVESRQSFGGWMNGGCEHCHRLANEHKGTDMWCPEETSGEDHG